MPAAPVERDDAADDLGRARWRSVTQSSPRRASRTISSRAAPDRVADPRPRWYADARRRATPRFWGCPAASPHDRWDGPRVPHEPATDQRDDDIDDDAPGTTTRPTTGVSPEPIMRIASGFMAAKHLFAASELGLFEALAESPATLEALAARTGLTPRAARISADAMVALGLLERDGDTLPQRRRRPPRSSPGARRADLRPFLRFWDRISYPAWAGFAEALGQRTAAGGLRPRRRRSRQIVSAGIEAILVGPANALPTASTLAAPPAAGRRRRHRLVGDRRRPAASGSAGHGVRAARSSPRSPASASPKPGSPTRSTSRPATPWPTTCPPGHDVFLLANLIHYWSPDENRDAAAPGARRRRAAARGCCSPTSGPIRPTPSPCTPR